MSRQSLPARHSGIANPPSHTDLTSCAKDAPPLDQLDLATTTTVPLLAHTAPFGLLRPSPRSAAAKGGEFSISISTRYFPPCSSFTAAAAGFEQPPDCLRSVRKLWGATGAGGEAPGPRLGGEGLSRRRHEVPNCYPILVRYQVKRGTQ